MFKYRFFELIFSLSVLLIISCFGCSEKQTSTGNIIQSSLSDTSALPVTIPEGDSSPPKGTELANQIPKGAIVDFYFTNNGKNVAYSVSDYGYSYVSINGKLGRVYKADVTPVLFSPDGKRIAYGAAEGNIWRMVVDGNEGDSFDQIKDPQFTKDSKHVAYSALKHGIWGIVFDKSWHDTSSVQSPQFLFNTDSKLIAYTDHVDKDYSGRLVVADIKFSDKKTVIPAGVHTIITNITMTRVAAVVSTGKMQKIISFAFDKPDNMTSGAEYESIKELVFGQDGVSLAYIGEKAGIKYAVLNNREEVLGDAGLMLKEPPVIRPDIKGLAAIIEDKDKKVYLREFFLNSQKIGKKYDGANFITYSRDGVPAFAAASASKKAWYAVVNGNEGSPFDRVVGLKFSPNGKYLLYRVRKDGKRFVVLADATGKILHQYPAYEQVFDVQFAADSKSFEYGVKDGRTLIWKVEKL